MAQASPMSDNPCTVWGWKNSGEQEAKVILLSHLHHAPNLNHALVAFGNLVAQNCHLIANYGGHVKEAQIQPEKKQPIYTGCLVSSL